MDNVTKFIKEIKKKGWVSRHYRDSLAQGCRLKLHLPSGADKVGVMCLAKEYFKLSKPVEFVEWYEGRSIAYVYIAYRILPQF